MNAIERWQSAINSLEDDYPTGAWGMSDKSAYAQLRIKGGTYASKAIVEYNAKRLPTKDYIKRVNTAARKFQLPTTLLLAVFGRESNHGRNLNRGYGDKGKAFGVGQVDGRYHKQKGKTDPYSVAHMAQAAGILYSFLKLIESKHPDWDDKYKLKGAVVAYNSGPSNVRTIEGMDRGTTHNDYGADVMARAKYWSEYV